MRHEFFYILILMVLIYAPLLNASAANYKTTPLESHQPVRAKVIDSNPTHFTINVEDKDNLGVNEDAPTFALYTISDPPDICADFSGLDLKYQKPEKYKRVFDLSRHKEVLQALAKYQCVVVKNKSSP